MLDTRTIKRLIIVNFTVLVLTISAMGIAAVSIVNSSHEIALAANSSNIHKVNTSETSHWKKHPTGRPKH